MKPIWSNHSRGPVPGRRARCDTGRARHPWHRLRDLGLAAAVALLAGCGSDAGGPTAPPPPALQPATVAVNGGDTQTAMVGSPVQTPPSVRISTGGIPVPGVTVRFEVVAGGGSVAGSPAVSDATGVATLERWTLGTAAGTNELRATVTGAPAVGFEAVGTPGVPKALVVVQGDGQVVVAGSVTPVSPAAAVRDTFANPIPGVTVVFSVEQGGGSVTGAHATTDSAGVATVGGWTLGPGVGEHRLLATVTGLPPVGFSATSTAGAPAAATAAAGEGQTAPAGTPVPVAPAILVTDDNGNPVAGAGVHFSIASGGGSVSGGSASTNEAGIATVGGWSLGATPGPNSLIATVTGGSVAGNPVTFTATGTGGAPTQAYDIVIRFNDGSIPTTAQQQAFDAAEARWEQVVIGDLPDVSVNRAAGTCSSTSPINEIVDDLLIFVTIEPIDGAGGVLGSAGPCLIRSGSNLPLAGSMRLDTADLPALESSGLFDDVVLHEMGHVLGIGSLWSLFGFLADPSGSGGLDPHFTGPQANTAFNALGGSGYPGAKVPVEDTGGSGTADAHWRETVFDREVMTGWIDSGSTPLSAVTVSSLTDHGYAVDPSSADPLSLSFSPSIGPSPGISPPAMLLADDVAHGPIEVVDTRGRTERVIPN